METDIMGAACAHKKIVDNGKTYTLLAIVPRNAGYEREWGGNFRVGRNGNHNGFRIGCEKVPEFTKKYVSSHKISGNVKVWTAGYSRGAGVDNQVAAALIDDPKTAIGVDLKPGNLKIGTVLKCAFLLTWGQTFVFKVFQRFDSLQTQKKETVIHDTP